MLHTSKTEDPQSGFVVDGRLIAQVRVLVIDDGPVPKCNPATSRKCAGPSSNRQELVLLNVGGQSFKMAKSTLARYPESVLYKMVEECPEVVEKGEELFIDRNPKAFPLIQEIYRSNTSQGL